jgi:hypothetical protein
MPFAINPSITANLILGTNRYLRGISSTKGNDDVVVHAGSAVLDNKRLVVLLSNNVEFEVWHEWRDRIRTVNEDLKQTLLDADYCLSLSVGDLPDDVPLEEYRRTGIKWSMPKK